MPLLLGSDTTLPPPKSHISGRARQHRTVPKGRSQVTLSSSSGWLLPWAGAGHPPLGADSCLYATWQKINVTRAQTWVWLHCNSHLVFSETEWFLWGKSKLPITAFSCSALREMASLPGSLLDLRQPEGAHLKDRKVTLFFCSHQTQHPHYTFQLSAVYKK